MARRPWYTFDDFKAAVTDLQLADTLMRDAEQEFANALDLLKSEHPELPKDGPWRHTNMSQVFVNLGGDGSCKGSRRLFGRRPLFPGPPR